MSRPVRISDYLASELEKIAVRENRSLANLVQHLLTQAIALETRVVAPSPLPKPTDLTPGAADRVDLHFKPDFKK